MKTQSSLITLLLIVLMGSASPATARPRPGTPITGIIQKVDAKAEEVELLREDQGTVIKFTWGSRTTFLANGQRAEASLLKTGTRVEVIYYKPFFREASTSKVTLLPALKPQGTGK